MNYVLCVKDGDNFVYQVFGPFDTESDAEKWADEMEYDSADIFELREPEDV